MPGYHANKKGDKPAFTKGGKGKPFGKKSAGKAAPVQRGLTRGGRR